MTNFVGSEGNDSLTGSSGDDQILALQGDDSVVGFAGSDSIYGGMGADTLLGDQGNDLLLGNRGNDVLYGGQGDDSLYGGKGDDLLIGGQGNDFISGDQGDDTAAFAGTRASYTITQDAAGDYILSGANENATVSSVEHFQFSDGTVDAANLIQGTGGGSTPPAPTPVNPVIANTHTTTDSAEAPVNPFGTSGDHTAVVISDANAGATDSATITLTGGGGVLSGNGLITNQDGSYSLAAATPATLTSELDALTFTPTNATPGNTASTTFGLTVKSSAGTTASDSSTIVNDTHTAPAGPVAKDDYNFVNFGIAQASGNLITGDGETDSSGNPNTSVGADNPGPNGPVTVSNISYGPTSVAPDSNQGDTELFGTYGNLFIANDGSYTYYQNALGANVNQDTFNYTIKDVDAVTSSATLTINTTTFPPA